MCDKHSLRKCDDCLIKQYENPDMWCKKECIRTDLIPDEGISCSGMPLLQIRNDWIRQGKGMDFLLEKDQPPRPAYEVFMEQQKRLRECDVTVWFTDEKCPECGKDVITDGKLFWCGEMCIQNGTLGKDRKDYMGFISELIR